MSQLKSLLVKLSVLLTLIAFAGTARADSPNKVKTEVENLKIAGTFLTSRLDSLNPNTRDGEGSSWCMSQIKGGYKGSSTVQCVNEDIFVGVSTDCPGGIFKVDLANSLGGGAGTRTFPNAEDQIYFALTDRELCVDENGNISGVDRGIILGGIGRYEGATGEFEHVYSGRIQYSDFLAEPPQLFGSINGTGTWTINIVK